MVMRKRSGFTLVETVVALLLLQLGMLALAATAGVAARDLADTLVRRRGLAIARSRVDELRSIACASPGAGARTRRGGMVESWRVDAAGRARSVTDSVSVLLSRGRRGAVVARAWVLCSD